MRLSKGSSKTAKGSKAGKVPKGMHRMPDGTLMKDSAHKRMASGGSVTYVKRKDADKLTKVC